MNQAERSPGGARWFRSADPEAKAAELLVEVLREYAAPRFAIPGGSAARALPEIRKRLGPETWTRLRLTWVDERCVDLRRPESNRGEALRHGYLEGRSHRGEELPLYNDTEDPQRALARVGSALTERFGEALDVVLLGLGEDGHIASLFPDHPALHHSGLVAWIDDSPVLPQERITLTRRCLKTAQRTLVLAAGESKRKALERLWSGDPSLPATGLPGLWVVTDLELGGFRG